MSRLEPVEADFSDIRKTLLRLGGNQAVNQLGALDRIGRHLGEVAGERDAALRRVAVTEGALHSIAHGHRSYVLRARHMRRTARMALAG